jgi:hypothetical protein
VGFADKRKKMVLAYRVKRNILEKNQLIMERIAIRWGVFFKPGLSGLSPIPSSTIFMPFSILFLSNKTPQ